MSRTMTKRPLAEVCWPRPSLAGCLLGAFVRDTRDYLLPHEQRFNHFAAAPYCCLTWCFEGEGHLIDWPSGATDPHAQPLLPAVAFSGPQRQPTTSWNPGPVHAMMLVFYADAMAALAGLDVSQTVDRVVAAKSVLEGPLLALCHDVMRPGSNEARFRRLENGLDPLWQRARPPGHAISHRLADWTRSLALRAATSGAGRSARQIERRIRSWSGQSQRDLHGYGRTERLFEMVTAAQASGGAAAAQLATDAGFADQSHMIRQVRRETGFTPVRLQELIETDEAFWCYRLMAERF
jgi:AraC-like DNA-binding protein